MFPQCSCPTVGTGVGYVNIIFFLLLSLHLALGMSTSTYTRVTSSKSTVDERTRERDGHWSGPRQHFSLTKMLIRSFLGPLALPNLSTFSLSILRPKQLPKQSLSHQKCCFSIFNQDLTPLLLVAVNHSAQCAQSESCKRNMVYQLELISHNIQYPVLSSASIFSELRQVVTHLLRFSLLIIAFHMLQMPHYWHRTVIHPFQRSNPVQTSAATPRERVHKK